MCIRDRYNGNIKKAFAAGNVVMTSPESTMTTDTIHFDRNTQEAYFNSNGTIVNKNNTLKSKAGRYYLKEKKYQFLSAVELKNPEYTIKTNHLDYKTTQGTVSYTHLDVYKRQLRSGLCHCGRSAALRISCCPRQRAGAR